jgi:hypothetical protein
LYVVGFAEGGEIIIFAVFAIMTASTNQLYGTMRFDKTLSSY